MFPSPNDSILPYIEHISTFLHCWGFPLSKNFFHDDDEDDDNLSSRLEIAQFIVFHQPSFIAFE